MSRASFRITAAVRRHWSLLAVATAYLVTFAAMPGRGLWIVDNENRFLQAQALADGGFREYAIRWPGREIDPEYRMNPLRFDAAGSFQQVKDGQLIAVFQPTFIVLAAGAFKVLGYAGLYLLPLGGALAMLAGVGRLASRLGGHPRAVHLAVLLAGLATPAWFYSQTFWEHTTAAALCVWALVHLLRFRENGDRRPLAAGFGLLAAAIFFRDVLVMFAAIVLALLLIGGRGRRRTIVLTAGATLAAGLAALMAFQWATTGRPLGFHAGTLFGAAGGLLEHLGARPRIFQLYLVSAHPEPLWSWLLAAPFLVAFVWRPRWSARHGSPAVGVWALAAAATGAIFLIGFLTGTGPLQRMLAANGFFIAAPMTVLGLLRTRREPGDAPGADAELLLTACCLYFVAYCLVAPLDGAVSLHWGGRFQFVLYPLLAALAARTLDRWLPTGGPQLNWRTAAVALLLTVSVADQVYAVSILRQKRDYSERLDVVCRSYAPRFVITNVWWLGHELYASFQDKTVFYVTTQEQFEDLSATLSARGVRRIVYVSRPGPGAAAPGATRIAEGPAGFYALEFRLADLR